MTPLAAVDGDMTAEDVRADVALLVARRSAALMRQGNADEVRRRLAALDRLDLEVLAFCAMALIQPGPVDAWWQRPDGHAELIAYRRRVLLGEAA